MSAVAVVLQRREATWLNAARARIPEMLSLRLEPETARPLAEATRPKGFKSWP